MKTMTVKTNSGGSLRFNLTSAEKKWILPDVITLETYFPKISGKEDYKLNERDIIIDVGANVGLFCVYAARIAKKGKVFAFEPVKENFDRLINNININKIKNIVVENKGLSNKKKKAKIYLCEKNTGGHSTNKNKFAYLNEKIRSTEMIELITLQDVFDTYKIKKCNFLKIDCEGEEFKILKNLPTSYFKRIDKIVLEYHPGVNSIALGEFLYNKGFRVTINNIGRRIGMIYAIKRTKRK